MKKLTLIRHAKSSWADSGLDDFDRPLNDRGIRNAPRIAEELVKINLHADKVYVSAAKRTRETFSLLNGTLNWPEESVEITDTIYEASALVLYNLVRNCSDDADDLVLVGHNPGLSELAFIFLGNDCPVMVTCAVIQISFEVDSWSKIAKGLGTMELHLYPKMFSDE